MNLNFVLGMVGPGWFNGTKDIRKGYSSGLVWLVVLFVCVVVPGLG